MQVSLSVHSAHRTGRLVAFVGKSPELPIQVSMKALCIGPPPEMQEAVFGPILARRGRVYKLCCSEKQSYVQVQSKFTVLDTYAATNWKRTPANSKKNIWLAQRATRGSSSKETGWYKAAIRLLIDRKLDCTGTTALYIRLESHSCPHNQGSNG